MVFVGEGQSSNLSIQIESIHKLFQSIYLWVFSEELEAEDEAMKLRLT